MEMVRALVVWVDEMTADILDQVVRLDARERELEQIQADLEHVRNERRRVELAGKSCLDRMAAAWSRLL